MKKIFSVLILSIIFSCSIFEDEEGYSKVDDLQFLKDIIEQNNLTEKSSTFDSDNGDGVFEPLELGNQKWENDRLINLDLALPNNPGQNLRDSVFYNIKVIPASMIKADKLEYLLIHKSDLSVIPNEILSHPSMKNLHLANNKIEKIPESIFNMRNLEILSLFGNELRTVPSSISKCPKLRSLILSVNHIDNLPSSIWDIKTLNSLYVEVNELTELPDHIDKIEEFGYLKFSKNKISKLPEGFENIKVLYGLDLYENSLFCNNGAVDSSLVPEYLFSGVYNFGIIPRDRQIFELQNCSE